MYKHDSIMYHIPVIATYLQKLSCSSISCRLWYQGRSRRRTLLSCEDMQGLPAVSSRLLCSATHTEAPGHHILYIMILRVLDKTSTAESETQELTQHSSSGATLPQSNSLDPLGSWYREYIVPLCVYPRKCQLSSSAALLAG